jgi:PP-loop superfamily ATP-utilizing enzyme
MNRHAHDIDERISRIEAWFVGRAGALVALSGGVDSTLLLTIAVRALGPR